MGQMNRQDETPGLERRFPTLTEILGAKDVQRAFYQLSLIGKDADALFHQAEIDLRYLKRRLSVQALGNAYKKQLLDETQFIQTVYEIYTAALLASVSEDIELHAAGKGNKDCDFRVKIHGCEIYGDVKTRYDKFPFNLAPKKDDSGETLYTGSRATIDYRVADATADPGIDKPTSESTSLREIILEDAFPKMPQGKSNIIVLGFLGEFYFPSTTREHLHAALFGDYSPEFHGHRRVRDRLANGVFNDPTYGELITSVAWLSLGRSSSGMVRRSGIFFNSNAKHRMPEEVELTLEQQFDREKTLNRELARIVVKLKSDYQPEKIILFGSLAQGNIKEGSDIDLAIIKETDKRPLDRSLEAVRISEPSLAVNFTVYTPAEFRQKQQTGDFFVIEEILQKGRVLYER